MNPIYILPSYIYISELHFNIILAPMARSSITIYVFFFFPYVPQALPISSSPYTAPFQQFMSSYIRCISSGEDVQSWQRLAGIVTRLWVLKYGGQVQQEQEISSFPNVHTACGAHPDSVQCMGTLFTVVKYLTHEAEPSSPSSTKVANEWSYATASLMPSWLAQGHC